MTAPEAVPPQDIRERVFRFAVQIIRLCRQLRKIPGLDRSVVTQLLRAGTSIGANVEEAQAGQSTADFINKYSIALKEARETVYWLRLLSEAFDPAKPLCKELLSEADQIARILGSIIVRTKNRRDR